MVEHDRSAGLSDAAKAAALKAVIPGGFSLRYAPYEHNPNPASDHSKFDRASAAGDAGPSHQEAAQTQEKLRAAMFEAEEMATHAPDSATKGHFRERASELKHYLDEVKSGRASPETVRQALEMANATRAEVGQAAAGGAVAGVGGGSAAAHAAIAHMSDHQLSAFHQQAYANDPIYREQAKQIMHEADAAHEESKKREDQMAKLSHELGVNTGDEEDKLKDLNAKRAAAAAKNDLPTVLKLDVEIAKQHQAMAGKNVTAADKPGVDPQKRHQAHEHKHEADEERSAAEGRYSKWKGIAAQALERAGNHKGAEHGRSGAKQDKHASVEPAATGNEKPKEVASLGESNEVTSSRGNHGSVSGGSAPSDAGHKDAAVEAGKKLADAGSSHDAGAEHHEKTPPIHTAMAPGSAGKTIG